jgi:hypothetical protein
MYDMQPLRSMATGGRVHLLSAHITPTTGKGPGQHPLHQDTGPLPATPVPKPIRQGTHAPVASLSVALSPPIDSSLNLHEAGGKQEQQWVWLCVLLGMTAAS